MTLSDDDIKKVASSERSKIEEDQMQSIFAAYIHLQKEGEPWTAKSLETMLKKLGKIKNLSDKKRRQKLVDSMSKDWTWAAQGFKPFDNTDSSNGNPLF